MSTVWARRLPVARVESWKAVSAMRKELMSQMMTVALAVRYLMAMALPRPLAPPVMRAVLPDRSAIFNTELIDMEYQELFL